MVMNMGLQLAAGALYRYTPAQGLVSFVQGLLTPNGLAFSPDGRTMYLSDSHPMSQKIWCFDYNTQTGEPSNQRLWVDMQQLTGRPDGAAIDSDGCYWICANDAGLVHRFTPQGQLDMSIALPIKKPAMCAFGGDDLRTLFITSIRPSNMDLTDQPLAGGVFAVRVPAQGLPEPFASFS
jgi:sugar lactone lactonase YvrE